MIRGLRKRKGDVTITTVILIVLGLAVLVMMILGFTKGWNVIFKPFDRAPSELQTLAKACAIYAQGSLNIDFCKYNLIGKELVNCRHPQIIDSLKTDGINTDLPSLRCDNNLAFKQNACKTLAAGKYGTTTIEGVTCASLLCVGTSAGSGPSSCAAYDTQEKCQDVSGCTWQG